MDLPYIGDINLRRNWNLTERTRRRNWERQMKYQRAHKYDPKPINLDKRPQGNPPTWEVHALCDKTDLITFIGACRVDGTIQGICGCTGREVELSPTISQPDARALVIAMVSTLKPIGNKSPRPRKNGHSIGGNRRESSAFWSTWS